MIGKNGGSRKKTSLHDSHVALPTFFVAPSISQMGNLWTSSYDDLNSLNEQVCQFK
jgi:hypothetical protein